MNVPLNNQSLSISNPETFTGNWSLNTRSAGQPAGAPADNSFFLITRFQLKEMEEMKTSFRNQVRNVVALDQFIRKRIVRAGNGLGGAEPALIGIDMGEELSFRLPGSAEAFSIFTATLKQKSLFLHHRSTADLEKNILKVKLKVADMAALEQELSIILENIRPTDYVFTVLQRRHRNVQRQKLAG
ncbi:MAG: hypothetical protein JWQ14_897 [Adhaeribacter sp.]|nr:hypothetical protein [Adhaeribacter sp.]